MSKVTSLRGQNTMPLQALLDRPVAYHCAFVKLGVGATGALMLSQAVYWSCRTNDKEGWFYKSQVEWEAEIGLTRYEQEGARRKLVKLGIMQEMKKGVPCKLYYRISLDCLVAILDAQNQQTSMWKTPKQDGGKPPILFVENHHAITENTAETSSVPTQAPEIADFFEGSQYRPMTLGWKPEAKALKAYAFAQGVSTSLITDALIASFTCHHSAHPEVCDTTAGWTNKLVRWAKSERVQAQAAQGSVVTIPFQEIVDLYHELCTRFALVTVVDKKLKELIAERWAEHEVHQDLEFWRDYLSAASVIGEVFYRGQKRSPFLEAIVSRDVFRDVMEGRANA